MHSDEYDCEWCDRTFGTEQAARQHTRAKHPTCHECDREFGTPQSLAQHRDAKHKLLCSECGILFDSSEALDEHCKDIHFDWQSIVDSESESDSDTESEIECRWCSRTFATEHAMSQHIRAKHYVCAKCDRDFSGPQAFQRHKRDKHSLPYNMYRASNGSRKNNTYGHFDCAWCNRRLCSWQALEQHVRARQHL